MKRLRDLNTVTVDGEVTAEEWADESEDTKEDAPEATEASGTANESEGVSNGCTPVLDDDGLQVGVIVPDPELLEDVVKFARRYVVMADAQADAAALWMVHTHAFDVFRTTPYLWVTSAVRESGKSTFMRVLRALSSKPRMAGSISTAALYRIVEVEQPTLLLDEQDATFKGDKERGEAFRGVLNTGFEYDGVAIVCSGQNHDVKAFPTFCPKALASIGTLWDTVESRSISIRLERMLSSEVVEYFDRDEVDEEADALRTRIAQWVNLHQAELRQARPESDLERRVRDIWRPLLAIADVLGDEWPERARRAASELSTGEARQDDSRPVKLLADIRTVFNESDIERFRTADLITALSVIEESPWGDMYGGKAITSHQLSRLLQSFRIKTMPVWAEGKTVKGYKREQFEDAWARYLPPLQGGVRTVRAVRSGSSSHAAPNSPNSPNPTPGTNGKSDPMRIAKVDPEERERLIRTYRPELNGAIAEGSLTLAEVKQIAAMLALQERTGVICPPEQVAA
jgi:Protein of unknown function (DUF3631)